MRIRETYLRGDHLLVRMEDTLLGEGRGGQAAPPRNEGKAEGRETTVPTRNHADGDGKSCYVCPTADFLQCYLELFDRPNFTACFRHAGGGSEAAGVGEFGAKGLEEPTCSLLLLHSELSKLTGATGALSMKQERRLAQVHDTCRSCFFGCRVRYVD